ncbi:MULTISPECIES: cupin domain-containing protein [Fischerella]|uniref:Cupin domain-containing protein n=1 Tax=Fischerella muscicola CCMEE 5323 TaxID=2019572 RepID=A0A2N6K047_FISMU|nr:MULTISPECIES: cupin domain-containing protein [Fischerella]MBD2430792.1 cupin domain-containing protein [Fischerella sp. FACHB-380]PLZ87105.1 cupin domain-containing protein [Fischerella muscicola CCMEE 5323]
MTSSHKTTLVQRGKGSTYLALGDLYTFLATGEDTGGAYSITEVLMQPQSVIPSHRHDQADEAHYILEGEIEYQLEDQTIIAYSGTFLNFPKNQYHGFKNIGSNPAKILMIITPSGAEQFFSEMGQRILEPMSEEEKRNLLCPPNPADIEKAIEVAVTKYGLQFLA